MEAVMKYMGILMVVVYLVFGVIVLSGPQDVFYLPEPYARIFGVVLILYGAFRGYRIYRHYFQQES